MAIKTSRVDDLDGETPATETKTFMVDGVTYEIDLSAANVKAFDKDTGKWTQHARVVGKIRGRRPGARVTRPIVTSEARINNDAVRAWGRQNGYKVSDRGAVPGILREAFDQAHARKPEFSGASS